MTAKNYRETDIKVFGPSWFCLISLLCPIYFFRDSCLKLKIETLGTSCEICSKLAIKIPERRQWRT